MKYGPLSFRVCDFSEQFTPPTDSDRAHSTYSVVAHVDGKMYQYKYAIPPDFSPPLPTLRSSVWLDLLRQISEAS